MKSPFIYSYFLSGSATLNRHHLIARNGKRRKKEKDVCVCSGSNENVFARGLRGRRSGCLWVRAHRDTRGQPLPCAHPARQRRHRRAPRGAGYPLYPLPKSGGVAWGSGGQPGPQSSPEPLSQRPAGEDPSRGAMLGGAARRGGPTLFSLRRRILVIFTY